MKNLHQIARSDNRTPIFFVQHSKICVKNNNIRIVSKEDDVSIQPNSIGSLLLGPGTSITHEAVKLLCRYRSQIQWVGDDILHTYSYTVDIHKSSNLNKQVYLVSNDNSRLLVAKRMYGMRFEGDLSNETIDSLRGKEGARVKQEYQRISKKFGVKWSGRNYDKNNFDYSDLPNKMISLANHLLYGVCLSMISQLGFSPALGFIHRGFGLSFVYDIADFYKIKYTIPIAFESSSFFSNNHSKLVRDKVSELVSNKKFISQIEKDINYVMSVECSK